VIEFLQTMMDAALHYGGLMLIHGTALALVAALLSITVFRHTRPAFRAALWLVVLTKFLVPPILPGEMAFSDWISRISTTVTANRVVEIRPQQSAFRHASGDPTSNDFGGHTGSFGLWLFSVYLAFLVLLTVRSLWILIRTNRKVRGLPAASNDRQTEVKALSQQIGLTRMPDVRLSDENLTPYIFGFWRPIMVLPRKLIDHLEPLERRALILHELAHVRRKDVLVRVLQGAARIVFFFFPPVLWVCRRIDHFAEMACDEWAVTISGVEPDRYAGALIKVVRIINHSRQPGMGVALLRNVRLVENRVRAVLCLSSSGHPRLSVPLKAVLIAWFFFGLLGGPHPGTAARIETPANFDRLEANLFEAQFSAEDIQSKVKHGKRFQQKPDKASTERIRESREPAQVSPEATGGLSQEAKKQSEKAELTPYERGFLLARQYVQEKADFEKAQTRPSLQLSSRGREYAAKRELELRAQERARHPF